MMQSLRGPQEHNARVRMCVKVKAVSVEEDENGGADTDDKTNANWILQNI